MLKIPPKTKGQKAKGNHQPALSSSDSWEGMVLIVLLELSYPLCLLDSNLYIWVSQYKFVLQQTDLRRFSLTIPSSNTLQSIHNYMLFASSIA